MPFCKFRGVFFNKNIEFIKPNLEPDKLNLTIVIPGEETGCFVVVTSGHNPKWHWVSLPFSQVYPSKHAPQRASRHFESRNIYRQQRYVILQSFYLRRR